MKKLMFIIVILAVYFNCQSQNSNGTYQIGVGGFPIIYPDNSLPTGYSLRANIGYFPTDNFAIGLMPFVGKVEQISSAGANLYLRYYVINKRFSLFGEATTGFGNLKYESSTHLNGSMLSFAIGPGVDYSFQKRLSIEVLLQYARLKNISYPEQTLNGNTFIPTIGIQYFFRK